MLHRFHFSVFSSFRIIALLSFFLICKNLAAGLTIEQPKREMRAVWIATVANIDFPSSRWLTAQAQQEELISLLDYFAATHINTVIFQARPTADAFYKSEFEPWSHWLTGKQGVEPYPYYDPLQFLIEEAHRRCMEVHVWLNPYRTLNSSDTTILSKNHIFNKQRHLFVKYDEKYYFNPGLPETRTYLNNVVKELVTNYDIDAVHFDDYFYPYPNGKESFPDAEAFQRYNRGFKNRNDWRRDNVTLVIKELQQSIKSIKPWVDFGVSPFGIWRNKSADPRGSQTKGLANYDDLYADILLWDKEKYLDYITPQLYWEIGKKNVDYRVVLNWWEQNIRNSNLYIGLYASGFEHAQGKAWQKPNELVRQMYLNRSILGKNVQGEMFYSAKYFVQNPQGLTDSLKTVFYQKPALTPLSASQKKKGEKPEQPEDIRLETTDERTEIAWKTIAEDSGEPVWRYVVYAFKGKDVGDIDNAENIIGITSDNCYDLSDFVRNLEGNYTFTVTAVNKYRQESKAKDSEREKF